ncbi:MAG: tetratricopeptide repeat protein [Firmicutes bacterium]|nr:tetratricopeptide repeat protein [Bacillota bacterium]
MKKFYTLLLSLTLFLFAFAAFTGCGPKSPATPPAENPAQTTETANTGNTTNPANTPNAANSPAAPAQTSAGATTPSTGSGQTGEAAPSPSPTKKPRPVVNLTDAQKKQVAKMLTDAVNLENSNKISEAVALYFKVLAIDPNNSQAFDGRARLQMRQSSFPDALEAYENVIDIDPKNVDGWSGVGRCRKELNQFDAAVTAYEQALALKPDYEPALAGLALTYFYKGHSIPEKEKRIECYKKSVEFFKKAIAADDKRDGNYKRLLDAAKIWWELDPSNAEPVKEANDTAEMFYKKFPNDKRLTPAIKAMVKEMIVKSMAAPEPGASPAGTAKP